ncbi:MAG TPA: universal stress protein [Pyrinomonadaceae bacterium]|nr:universal stress protein [Pyrinomonadaceae bacterium]
MITIERILCPTDLSTESDEALRYAVALARAYNAKLLLLYCAEINSAKPPTENRPLSRDIACSFEQALIRHLGLAELCDIKWEALAIENVRDVGDAISHQAKTHRADLIVMRSRRRPHAAILLGSTAQKVSRTAPCPVLVTHPNETEWVSFSTGEIDLRRVLIAHDFSSDSELALKYGGSLAQEYQAEVHLLHVLDGAGHKEPELSWSASSSGSACAFFANKLQRAIPEETFLWCNVVKSVRSGKVHEEVLTYAKEQSIDLICMGASGSDWSVSKLFGSNVDRVLRQAPCPMLVARPIRTAELTSGEVTLN